VTNGKYRSPTNARSEHGILGKTFRLKDEAYVLWWNCFDEHVRGVFAFLSYFVQEFVYRISITENNLVFYRNYFSFILGSKLLILLAEPLAILFGDFEDF